MDAKFFLGIGLAVVLVFAGAGIYSGFSKLPGGGGRAAPDRDILYQVSTIDALQQGVFDGVKPAGELKKHGDFGIGTFDNLDGEMIVLDGTVYQAKADGTVAVAPDTETVPFATVTFFDRDIADTTPRTMNLSEFSSVMSGRLPSGNMIYAVRMHGTFPFMKVRSIPAQQEPFPPLAVAAANQSVFTYTESTGTVIGISAPVFLKGLNVAGFHLHFISDDRKMGGHILDCEIPAGTRVEYDITPGFTMVLPESGDFTGADLSQDLTGSLAKIER